MSVGDKAILRCFPNIMKGFQPRKLSLGNFLLRYVNEYARVFFFFSSVKGENRKREEELGDQKRDNAVLLKAGELYNKFCQTAKITALVFI